MFVCWTVHRLLLAGTCLCVYGTRAQLLGLVTQATQGGGCKGRCADLALTTALTIGRPTADQGGAAPPLDAHLAARRRKGAVAETPAGNGDRSGRFGPSEAGDGVWRERREAVMATTAGSSPEAGAEVARGSDSEDVPVTRGGAAHRPTREGADRKGVMAVLGLSSATSSSADSSPWNRVSSPRPSLLVPRGLTLLSAWGLERGVAPTPPDLVPQVGPDVTTTRQGAPESLWTEAVRENKADTADPLSPDESTEGTMSSESLPLIFEPSDDITLRGEAPPPVAVAPVPSATLAPGDPRPIVAVTTNGGTLPSIGADWLVTPETDGDGDPSSQAPPPLPPDWTSPWQTSGAELLELISPAEPSDATPPADTEPVLAEESAETDDSEKNLPTLMTVTKATRQPVSKLRSGFEEMESEEDEDEEDENTEDSEEDLTTTPKAASTRIPYSFIPPPPIWVQRNQGLMRSWVELIREKVGYVSGMLAPVGIGIAGALLIVGALYSIRTMHRKRRYSFKHQRRKTRQPEHPQDPGTNRQDQAMLLADSSEDEF